MINCPSWTPTVALLYALSMALLVAGCDDRPQPAGDNQAASADEQVMVVQTVEAEPVALDAGRVVAGVVGPIQRARMGTRQAGTVEQVLVEAGDRVEAGQPILRVDARDLQAAVRAARMQQQAAEAASKIAQRNEQRFQRLFEQRLIARARLEEVELAARDARGRLQLAEAELSAAEVNLDYATLHAPFDGVVSEIIAEVGTFVAPGPALVVFENRSRLEVNAAIDQQAATGLAPGDLLQMSASGIDAGWTGRVLAVLPALRENGVGQRLRLVIDQPPAALEPGMVVELRLPGRREELYGVTIPVAALLRRGQLDGVFVVERDDRQQLRARLRWIAVAEQSRNSSRARVMQGLSEGERVVVGDAVHALADDQPVALADP